MSLIALLCIALLAGYFDLYTLFVDIYSNPEAYFDPPANVKDSISSLNIPLGPERAGYMWYVIETVDRCNHSHSSL